MYVPAPPAQPATPLRAYPASSARLDATDGLRGPSSSGSTWHHHAFALASSAHSTLGRPSRTSLSGYALTPVGIETPSTPLVAPTHTKLKVKRMQLDVLDGQRTSIAGALAPALPVARVDLQALTRHGWRTLAHTRTGAQGRYRLRYTPAANAGEEVRVYFPGDALHRAAHRRLGHLGVYHLAEASWYGGSGTLACGGQLTSSMLGVANRTLPCGTLVSLRYDGRSVRVPVIDRGPFVPGREFDLTEATKQALGFGDTGEVWVS